MRIRYWLAAGIPLLAACSTMNVTTAKDPTADLSKYRTYAWAPEPKTPSGEVLPKSIMDQTVKANVEKNLVSKNLVPVTPGEQPDLLIAYAAITRNAASYSSHYGYYGEVYREPYIYRQGALTLEFIDPKNNKVVWQGTASDAVNDAGADQKQITQAVNKILSEFPTV
jgi:hypothetical protein